MNGITLSIHTVQSLASYEGPDSLFYCRASVFYCRASVNTLEEG